MKTESKYASRFRDGVLLRHNCSILNLHGHAMQTVGWPDFYVGHKILGQFWIEFKVWPNSIYSIKNKRQLQRIAELRGKEIPVFVVTFYDDVEKAPGWLISACIEIPCAAMDIGLKEMEIVDFCKGKENESEIWDKMCKLMEMLRVDQ